METGITSLDTSEKKLGSLKQITIEIKVEIIIWSKVRDSLILVFGFRFFIPDREAAQLKD